jgi:hypothetical protein
MVYELCWILISVLILHVCSFGFPLLICLSSVFIWVLRICSRRRPFSFMIFLPPALQSKPAALLFFPSVVFLLLEVPALLIWFLASSIGLPLIYGCTQGGLFFLFEAAVFDFRLRVLLIESINRERCGLLILSRAQVFLPRFSFLPPPSRLSGRCSRCPGAQLHLP